MTPMWTRSLKILFGVLLIPFCLGFTWQFGSTVFAVVYKPDVPYYFLAGGLAYLTVHLIFRKPILSYVFAHELTHALFAVLFGGSVKAFHATERGGHVRITKSNFIITLAPYFFPLYTFIALILTWIARAADVRGADGWLVFLAGASYTFHVVLTAIFLRTDQNDIREQGALFSYPLIYLFNLILAGLLVHLLLAENMGFVKFLGDGIIESITVAVLAFKKLHGVIKG